MSSPAAKRRRIDAASQALSKPFRSPLKIPLAGNTADRLLVRRLSESLDAVQTEDNETLRILDPIKVRVHPTVTPSSIKLEMKTFSSPIVSTAVDLDPAIATLIKTRRQLEKQVRELKEDLDTAEQARRIEANSKKNPGGVVDEELSLLVLKWRAASRQAAEELFTGVRDRVNRMGGPKAWNEMQERQKEFQNGWDKEPPQQDSDDEEGQDVEKRDLYAEYDIDPETAHEKEARGGNDILEDEVVGDEFTMAMMLRSLNVPLSTIGYDKENQRWID